MPECKTCGNWDGLNGFNAGNCELTGIMTSGGYRCLKHSPVRVAKPEKEAPAFDVSRAADKVMAAHPARIDIVSVQAALRCQYRQAAQVIELLKQSGRIK